MAQYGYDLDVFDGEIEEIEPYICNICQVGLI